MSDRTEGRWKMEFPPGYASKAERESPWFIPRYHLPHWHDWHMCVPDPGTYPEGNPYTTVLPEGRHFVFNSPECARRYRAWKARADADFLALTAGLPHLS